MSTIVFSLTKYRESYKITLWSRRLYNVQTTMQVAELDVLYTNWVVMTAIKYYRVDKHEEVVERGYNIIEWTNMKKWLGEDKILYSGQT